MDISMLAFALLLVLAALLVSRFHLPRRRGIAVMHFGKLDKTDYIIPPFAFFYFYHILANAFGWPGVAGATLVQNPLTKWLGAFLCVVGLALVAWSLTSFGDSLRVGIDIDTPGALITSGAFAVTRNPLYLGFKFFLFGQFLMFPTWMFFLYPLAAFWLMNRQILREEDFLRQHYGAAFNNYCEKVHRYL